MDDADRQLNVVDDDALARVIAEGVTCVENSGDLVFCLDLLMLHDWLTDFIQALLLINRLDLEECAVSWDELSKRNERVSDGCQRTLRRQPCATKSNGGQRTSTGIRRTSAELSDGGKCSSCCCCLQLFQTSGKSKWRKEISSVDNLRRTIWIQVKFVSRRRIQGRHASHLAHRWHEKAPRTPARFARTN